MKDVIIQVSSLIIIILTTYLKQRSENKVQHKEINDKIKNIQKDINEINENLSKFINEDTFKEHLKNILIEKSYTIIISNPFLSKEIISVLKILQTKITQFAIDYSFSKFREKKYIIRDFIYIEAKTMREEMRNFVNDAFSKKKYIDEVKGEMYFFDYMYKFFKNKQIVNNAVIRLVENGMDKQEYINLFSKLIEDLFLEYIKAIKKWEQIE